MIQAGRGGDRRWWLWGPLLTFAAGLTYFGDSSPESAAVSLPTRRPTANGEARVAARAADSRISPATARAISQTDDSLSRVIPRTELISQAPPSASGAASPRDPFVARTWNAAPPPHLAPSQVLVPAPPPLPYAYIGKKQEGETWEVYLTRGEETFIARQGQVLEGSYRVDSIVPPTLTLTYLPLGQMQTISIGETR